MEKVSITLIQGPRSSCLSVQSGIVPPPIRAGTVANKLLDDRYAEEAGPSPRLDT